MEEEIQSYVDRLLQSPEFKIPARRARLLRYLAERVDAGQANQINEYAIGVDVFGQPESFDPKTDAVVRAEIRRLRQSLKDYYARAGTSEGVVLDLPARSYVPVFRALSETETQAPREADGTRKRKIRIAALAVLIPALAILLARPWAARTIPPPAFSLAVLPATVTAAARDFADRTDSFTQELIPALWSVRGWSVLGWMKTSGMRGPDAVEQARRRSTAALILTTEIDRRAGAYRATFRIFDRNRGKAVWSVTAPLGFPDRLPESARQLANQYLAPVMERDYDIARYRHATGRTRVATTLPEQADDSDPCARRLFPVALGQAVAQVTVGAQALDARSPDTRIEIFAAGQRAYPSTTVQTREGTPIELRAPEVVDLAADTCVLSGAEGDAPVYEDRCIVAPAGASDVRLTYVCSARAQPIDIGKLANDANLWNEETFPSGARLLAGVPFRIPDGVERFHDAGGDMRSARPVTVTIPVNRAGVSRAYFLMNTVWGQPGPASYLKLNFSGDGGAHYEKELIGGVDIRDYNRGAYTNSMAGGQTRPAFENGQGQRMDLIEVDLPAEFGRQKLTSITLTDTGRWSFQRAVLWGVSVR